MQKPRPRNNFDVLKLLYLILIFFVGKWDVDPIRESMTEIMIKSMFFEYVLRAGTVSRVEWTPMADPETGPS